MPYVTQYIYDTRGIRETRSAYYCGIASALMVRAKTSKGNSSAPPIYNAAGGGNYSHVNNDMRSIDTYLQNGRYGTSSRKVDVLYNQGLLYIGCGTDADQYWTTVEILQGVYRGLLNGRYPDGIANDNRHVSEVSMWLVSARDNFETKARSEATKAIWDHITNYNQPVVVVVDSNKQLAGGGIRTSSSAPTLHYIVIRGIRETSSGIRYFCVHNPAYYLNNLEYREADLIDLMGMYGAPEWVYRYGRDTIVPNGDMPAYILTVYGD
ncbi:hypothetical protein Holit_00433 [Hollandina sp. SP2]